MLVIYITVISNFCICIYGKIVIAGMNVLEHVWDIFLNRA